MVKKVQKGKPGVNVSLQTAKGKTYKGAFKNYVDLDITQL